ncbi:sensor histidine kinase [Aliamphritea ceti]|uniref:sensor histidine kinase n=1 Tax=Aliamphritea ceti TaxID=1524258 RepID=UPI0021C33312|nr:ATP-binding protein [Aliamphritea ceti]
MSDEAEAYKKAYAREKSARLEAEQLLDDKSRELFMKHQQLEETNRQLQEQHNIILRNEKLATLGTLSAGVAHEINNPLAFVYSNLGSLHSYIEGYQKLLKLAQTWQTDEQLKPEHKQALSELIEAEDLTFISEDIVELLKDSQEGLDRMKDIVQNLRRFAHSQDTDWESVDIVDGLESTLKILNSQLQDTVTVEKHFSKLPLLPGKANELNQTFLNIIVNACHAMKNSKRPTLRIETKTEGNEALIKITDNGCGMDEDVIKSLFDPFFTTKPVGEGTGMGMSISYSIIKDHQGRLSVASKPGVGTRFSIYLPLKRAESSPPDTVAAPEQLS